MSKILGLDVGDRYIGVAISDELGLLAQPLMTIKRESNKMAYEEIHKILVKEKIEIVVVGLPKNMNNTLGPQSQKVQKFADKLGNKYRVRIVYVDERMTTKSAQQVLIEGSVRRENRKQYVDKIAAAYILRLYLDQAEHL